MLDNPELRAAIGDHEFFFENKDGRIVLIFPLFDKVMIGTSDLPIEDPDSARCTEDEVDYFIEMVGRVFPGIKVSREQIVFRFSGVRPLAYTQGQKRRSDHARPPHPGRQTGRHPRLFVGRRQMDQFPGLLRAGDRPRPGLPRPAA